MKRYQIFISSTFTDLRDERSAVLESILKLRHIPVGMEQFVAASEEQFNYIKGLIDETDYYILLLGNRYGTVSEEKGVSYTEMEFDYAVSKNIPVLAFVHSNPDSLPINKSEVKKTTQEKLAKFRDKVKKNRLVSLITWDSPASLSREVVVALTNAINDYPRPGWERVKSYDNSELLNQINDLRIENEKLKQTVKDLTEIHNKLTSINDFPWDEAHCLEGVYWDNQSIKIPVDCSWRQWFSLWGPLIITEENVDYSRRVLCNNLFGNNPFSFSDKDFSTILMTFLKIGVIEVEKDRVCLTKEGRTFLLNNAVDTEHIIRETSTHAIQEIRHYF